MTLKNKDLRVGNLIASGEKFSNISSVGKVLEIGNDEIEFEQIYCECSESFDWFWKDNYCAIPLTDEMHEKLFSCKKNGYLEYVYDISKFGDDKIELVFSGDYLFIRDMSNGPAEQDLITLWNKDLKKEFYVHEFQNLYFLLTGKELELYEDFYSIFEDEE